MALTQSQKDLLNTQLAAMKAQCASHHANVKVITNQIGLLTKQVQVHETNAAKGDADIAAMEALINAG